MTAIMTVDLVWKKFQDYGFVRFKKLRKHLLEGKI